MDQDQKQTQDPDQSLDSAAGDTGQLQDNTGTANDSQPVFDLAVGQIAVVKPDDPGTVFVPHTGEPFMFIWTEGRVDNNTAATPAFTDNVLLDGAATMTASADPLSAGQVRQNGVLFSAGLTEGAHQLNVFLNANQDVNETNFLNNIVVSPVILDIQNDPFQNNGGGDSSGPDNSNADGDNNADGAGVAMQ